MNKDESNKLIDAYIRLCQAKPKTPEYEADFWAHSTIYDLTYENPSTLWQLILEILEKDSSDRVIALLSAGPLEDLLAKYGDRYIERVELQARQDPKFRHLLGGVWKNAMTDTIWQRVQIARLHKSW